MQKLTKRVVEAAACTATDYQIPDSELPGFGLRVRASGRKSFYLQYRAGSKTRKFTIGYAAAMSVEEARLKATQLLASVRAGSDPVGDKLAANMAPTVNDLADRYLKEHCETHVKPKTLVNYRHLLKSYILPDIGHLKVTEVSRSHIANLHYVHSKHKTQANRILEIVSKMFNLAEQWGWRTDGTNPRRHIKKFKETKRERYLSFDEMRRLGEALNMAEDAKLLSSYAVALFRLLLLTGARLSEIQFCKWEWIDFDNGVIRLPDSKTGAKLIPVGRISIEILMGIKRKPGNPYVICSEIKEAAPINNVQSMWQQIRGWANLKDVRIHDLRHTFASSAVNMKVTLPTIGMILGHSQPQTTARYAHLAVTTAIEAADKVNEQMGALLALPAPRAQEQVDEEPTVEIKITMPVFYSSDEAASYLNVKPRLMENWRWRKCGPAFVKIGQRIRYRQEDLDSFIKYGSLAHVG